ncbi:hypothetical protein AVEN_156614-1 [Araneus ventricosus]|uniref:Uncharacterized protein n=1 Tax=Araneus ventricosus TaxID=182803 RepID=A0A4Y2IVF1_ARAVE|nr:hypothetical protein AVEN_252984-1 [Araneus ventricosus]GBM81849.1 hypothetical protein AVEN_156614-1 [Araneus ventricosus]
MPQPSRAQETKKSPLHTQNKCSHIAKPPSSSLGDKKLKIQSGKERLRTLNLSFTNIDTAACFFCWKLASYGWKSYVSSKEQTGAIFPIVPT